MCMLPAAVSGLAAGLSASATSCMHLQLSSPALPEPALEGALRCKLACRALQQRAMQIQIS